MIFEFKYRIYGYDCDIYGHLNNSRYLQLFEAARSIALEDMGYPIHKMHELDIQIYLTRAEVDYKKAIPIDEIVTIKSYVKEINRLTSIWVQEIYNTKEEVCSLGVVKAVFIRNSKPFRIPEYIFNDFKKFMN